MPIVRTLGLVHQLSDFFPRARHQIVGRTYRTRFGVPPAPQLQLVPGTAKNYLSLPLEEGIFGELGTDDEGEAAARRIDDQVEELLREGDSALMELQNPAATSVDARFQAMSLLVGTLGTLRRDRPRAPR